MIKPKAYRKFYKELRLFEKNKNLILPMTMVDQATKDLTFRQKLYIFWNILFK